MLDADLKIVRFTYPQAFLEAIDLKKHDDSFLNFSLGSLMDSLNPVHTSSRNIEPGSRIMLGVYEGGELVAIFTRVKGDFAWQLSSLRDQLALEESFVSNVTSSLAKHLPTIIPPASFDFVFGHNALAEAFVNAYIAQLHSLGIHAKPLPPIFRSQISYATKVTLPPLSSAFSPHPVRLATMPNDLEAVALMYKQFHRAFEEETDSKCREEMSIWISLGLVWVCFVDGEPAGYVCAARPTPRTISIRNVFVKPEFRRKGVAETMVRAVSRYYLGAETVGFEGVPSSLPKEGVKEEICLNVIEEHIARLYRRCGYLLGEDDRDPATGRRGWIPTSFWTVDYSKE